MFDNAWIYNKKTSRVYKYCTKLSEVFDMHINSAMQRLGYCCGMRVSGVGGGGRGREGIRKGGKGRERERERERER